MGIMRRTTSHVLQLDEYFDTFDRQLLKKDLVIRICSNGEKNAIAFKSPRIELPCGITNRVKLEFLSADGENVQEQLLTQGLNPHESSEKELWTIYLSELRDRTGQIAFHRIIH